MEKEYHLSIIIFDMQPKQNQVLDSVVKLI